MSRAPTWLALLLLAGACHAAPAADPIAALATPVRIAATSDDDFADLAPFATAVGTARIVALDEQTHGGHEEYVLKTRLLRYLHERLGFDVLVLESGFYDVGQIQADLQAGAKLDDLAPDNIFYMYSKSAEGRGLLQYVDATRASAHPLTLAGMDSQHSGARSHKGLVPGLGTFLAKQGLAAPNATPAWPASDWVAFQSTVEALTALRQEPPPAAGRAAFDRVSQGVARALAGMSDPHPHVGSARWWGRVVADLQAQARQLWDAPNDNARDQAMGDNVAWIADHLAPGHRLVVWGHAIHLMHDVPDLGAQPAAGSVIHRRFGASYHVAHLTGLAGRYLDYDTLKPLDIPAANAGSLEARLATVPGAALYLPPAQAPIADAPAARHIDYQLDGPSPGRGLHWESTFFIRQLTPVTMVR